MAALGYTPVRDVDRPGRQPFEIQIISSGGPGDGFTVPAGKRLVITSIISNGPTTQTYVGVQTEVGGSQIPYYLPTLVRGNSAFASQAGEALAYADPGTGVGIYTDAQVGVTAVTITGYFVNVP
jgi:hypothetical protein